MMNPLNDSAGPLAAAAAEQQALFSRRKFLWSGAAAVGALALSRAGAQAASQPGSPPKKILHIIGHSHIDAAWLWPWRDASNIVFTTFQSALDRMSETPDFRYTHSSSQHYRWVERADPGLFTKIRGRIDEGRWEVVGGWPVEPDCNIPSTESFVRHSLYGKDYCRRALGVDVKIGFNPDSFGHAAGLPTILKGAGYDHYVFMRPKENEMKDVPLLFWWEGPDGSRVLTLRIYRDYDAPAMSIPYDVLNDFAPGFDHAAFFLGVGDHGGAVTREQIKQVLAMRARPGLPELRWSTLREFFAAVESSPAMAQLPVVKGELQHHSRGCYSANGEVKYQNRRAERSLVEAEGISLVAGFAVGQTYPGPSYAQAWWKVLFNQFHDVLAGTSLYTDYQDARDGFGWACETALTSKVEALEAIAKRVDARGVPESALFLFNPLPWRRRAMVEVHFDYPKNLGPQQGPGAPGPYTCLVGKDGSSVPIQWRPSDSMTNWFPRISAWVELPACGYKLLELGRGIPPPPPAYPDFFSLSAKGFGLSSLRAPDGTELLAAPIGLVVIRDTSDTWAHDVAEFREELGRPEFISSAVIENGPVTRVTRHRARWRNSDIALEIAQFAGVDVVELRFVVDWREHEQMLKLEIPTALAQPRVFAKVPGAILERRVNGEEEPYQDWIAVQGRKGQGDYTVALMNSSTYSYDCLGGLLRTVLIRSAPFARHRPFEVPADDNNAWQDQGRQERRFWLVAGNGAYAGLSLDMRAEELQTPAEYVIDSAHEGTEGWEKSFLEVSPASVAVLAMKRQEGAAGGTIVRLQDRSGAPGKATISGSLIGPSHTLDLPAYGIKTLLIRREPSGRSEIQEVSLLETAAT